MLEQPAGVRRLAPLLLLVGACGGDEEMTVMSDAGAADPDAEVVVVLDAGALDSGARVEDAGMEAPVDAGFDDAGVEEPPIEDGPAGFVGSACGAAADCDFDEAVCFDDYPRGMCSLPCDRLCPDREGHPTTFCVDGFCHARCDFGLFPSSGCRPGYGCVWAPRYGEPETETMVCLPGAESEISDCVRELAARGVDFEPTVIADRSPDTHPNLVCHVEDPVVIHPPIGSVDVKYYDGTPTPNIRAACNMALSLARTVDDLEPLGVTAIRHIGTYNCRVISGTDRLSRHAHADAIDIYGFDMASGEQYTLIDDWEHDTTMPMTPAGAFLYESAYRWHDDMIWTVILTPNYNVAHDNHFHVDLTPGSDFIQLLGDEVGYVGPAPYAD